MAGNDGDLFGDSSSDADTDDLIAAAKSQPIARKKDGAAARKKPARKTPDADAASDDDDSDSEDGTGGRADAAGLFDSSSEDEEDDEDSGPKAKKLGKKRRGKAARRGPPKKDTRTRKERMEALSKRRAGGTGGGGGDDEGGGDGEPRKKRSKPEAGGKAKGDGKGYESGDSYDSVDVVRTKADDDFIDDDDDDPDARRELYSEQHFDDERPDGYDSEEERKMKKAAGSGRKSSGGGGLDKISLSDDEEGEKSCASAALKAAVRRMQKVKRQKKGQVQLEEEGQEFLKRMEEAADADYTSIAKKRPAVKRLAMLQEVMDMLAKKDMVRVLLDLDLLTVCKRWVQPLPNGALGNVTLRRRIMEAVCGMTGENGITAHDLKRSGFGKVVMTLYKHRSETPEMKKLLRVAIEQWSRHIFQKSGNMRDLERAQAQRAAAEEGSLAGIARERQYETKMEERRRSGGYAGGGGGGKGRGKTEDDLAHIISKGSKQARDIGNNRVRVPFSKGFQYSVRPEDRKGNVADRRNLVSAKAMGGMGGGEQREALSKRMIEKGRTTNKQSQRSANISIEGRAVK